MALTPLGAVSCGSDSPLSTLEAFPVEGQVLFHGQPAPLARITFHPVGGSPELQKLRPAGEADQQGRFRLTTVGIGSGAPEGTYRVTVIWRGPDPGTDLQTVNPNVLSYEPNRLNKKYAEPATTTLAATITSGANRLAPFTVD
ncbi:MAG: hypothetical protein GTO03_02470 [Planctomycetales bacterium]|nr:hypothetical protein [Planctomycetales bacterium]